MFTCKFTCNSTCKFINSYLSQLLYANDSSVYFHSNKYHIWDFLFFVQFNVRSISRVERPVISTNSMILYCKRWSLSWSMFLEMTILWRVRLMMNDTCSIAAFSKWNCEMNNWELFGTTISLFKFKLQAYYRVKCLVTMCIVKVIFSYM